MWWKAEERNATSWSHHFDLTKSIDKTEKLWFYLARNRYVGQMHWESERFIEVTIKLLPTHTFMCVRLRVCVRLSTGFRSIHFQFAYAHMHSIGKSMQFTGNKWNWISSTLTHNKRATLKIEIKSMLGVDGWTECQHQLWSRALCSATIMLNKFATYFHWCRRHHFAPFHVFETFFSFLPKKCNEFVCFYWNHFNIDFSHKVFQMNSNEVKWNLLFILKLRKIKRDRNTRVRFCHSSKSFSFCFLILSRCVGACFMLRWAKEFSLRKRKER